MACPWRAAARRVGYLERWGVKGGFDKGQDESEIRQSLDLSIWHKLERSYVIGRNINRVYLEVEADSCGK